MVIGLLHVSLSIPEAHSLKDKRMVLRSLKDRVRNSINVSVAETDLQDVWKSAELAFVTVAADKKPVEQRLADIRQMLISNPRLVLLDSVTQML